MFSHPHDYNYTSAQATFVRVGRCIVVYNPIKTSLKLQRGNQNLKPGGGGGGGEHRCFGRICSSCPTCDARRFTVKRHERH